MIVKRRKWVSLLAAILILLNTVLPSVSFADGGSPQIADGEYDIHFVVRDEKDTKDSVMNGYAEKPAKLIVENGNKKIQIAFNNADLIHAFQPEQNGAYTDATIVSEDTENKIRVYEFPVNEIPERLLAKTHVIVPFIPGYDNWYEVLIVFDENDIANLPKVEDETNDESDEGNESNILITENVKYSIGFSAIRADNENLSSMDNKLLKPAILTYKNGKYYLSFSFT